MTFSALSDTALDQLFRQARTVHAFKPTADAQAGKVHTAGHEEGGSLCQLLDHLSQGSAPTTLLTAWAVMPVPQMQAPWALRWRHASVFAPFEARAPPLLA